MEIIVSDSQQQMFEYLARKIVDNLSKEYNFDSNEAISKLSLTKSRKDTDTVIPTKNNILTIAPISARTIPNFGYVMTIFLILLPPTKAYSIKDT